jgi:N6-adenosine-specific RNA methylase IME4
MNTPFADLIPPLTPQEYDQLEQSLLSEGCRDAIVVWKNQVIDGHNRFRICEKHGIPYRAIEHEFKSEAEAGLWIIRNQFARRNLTMAQKAQLALEAKPLISELAKERQKGGQGGLLLQNSAEAIDTRKELAKLAGVSHDTIHKMDVILAKADEGVREKVLTGDVSIHKVHADIRRQERRAEAEQKFKEVGELQGKYGLVYADPPWRYEHSETQARDLANQYPTLSLEEICAIRVPSICLEDCLLFLWVTSPKLEEGLFVMRSWGFEYRTSMVWVKDKIGMGYYARQQHEWLLIGKKGKPPVPSPSDRPSSIINAPRQEHSLKPGITYEIIEKMYPVMPKIELFARSQREGWSVWGNQT